jgi:hypothetical protein
LAAVVPLVASGVDACAWSFQLDEPDQRARGKNRVVPPHALGGQVMLAGENYLGDSGLVPQVGDELLERPAQQVFGLTSAGSEAVGDYAAEAADRVVDDVHERILPRLADALGGDSAEKLDPKWTPSHRSANSQTHERPAKAGLSLHRGDRI